MRDGVDAIPRDAADFPDDPGCSGPLGLTEAPACQDGIDNDGDEVVDFDGGTFANGGVQAVIDPNVLQLFVNAAEFSAAR